MKIIDFHTHYYPDKIVEKALNKAIEFIKPVTNGTRAGLLDSMRKNNIEYSVALPMVNCPENARSLNLWASRENHDEIIMFGSVHPLEEKPEETLKYVAELGMKGIKVHPEYQNFYFADSKYDRIWRSCIENDLIVLTHTGFDVMFPPPFHCTPADIAAVIKKHPELKLVAAHCGGMRMFEDVEKHLCGKEVYFDLAFMNSMNIDMETLNRLLQRHSEDHILYGSDSPWCDQGEMVEIVHNLSISECAKEKIFYKNAQKLLKMQKN
ncbi:MAG: amidohydrolase [Lentisphaeria bacterium]|nr:amidohydrolase [Lentisphaeria bacterium]